MTLRISATYLRKLKAWAREAGKTLGVHISPSDLVKTFMDLEQDRRDGKLEIVRTVTRG